MRQSRSREILEITNTTIDRMVVSFDEETEYSNAESSVTIYCKDGQVIIIGMSLDGITVEIEENKKGENYGRKN
jgi:hypothetical protein